MKFLLLLRLSGMAKRVMSFSFHKRESYEARHLKFKSDSPLLLLHLWPGFFKLTYLQHISSTSRVVEYRAVMFGLTEK